MPTAQDLYQNSVDLVRQGHVRAALVALLDTLSLDPVHPGALEAAGRICRMLGSTSDADLFEAVVAEPGSAAPLFQLAYRMVEQARPDVGAAMLEQCLRNEPADTDIRRELAYARLQNRDFEPCLAALAPLQDDPDLSETERLEVHLLQAEAALYARRRPLCQEFLDRCEDMVADDAQRERIDALHALLGRSRRWDSLNDLELREWHFIQHAGVILKTAGGYFEDGSRAGRFDMLDLKPDMVAFLLQRLVDLLQTSGLRHDVVAAASETSAPLAACLARLLDVPWVPELVERGERSCLLVASNAAEFGPLVAGLARNTSEIRLFSLNLDWERDAPVCPEVVGVLARRALLPWETRYAIDPAGGDMREVPSDPRPADEIGAEVYALVHQLPDDGGRARAEFEGYYARLRADLVLGNEEQYPYRRRFTSLSPCWLAGGDDGDEPAPSGPSGTDAPDWNDIPADLLESLGLDSNPIAPDPVEGDRDEPG